MLFILNGTVNDSNNLMASYLCTGFHQTPVILSKGSISLEYRESARYRLFESD